MITNDCPVKLILETLEDRIAPATFTFGDVDGDFVTVKTSKGSDSELAAIVSTAQGGLGVQLQGIDFGANPTVFDGTSLTITAKRMSIGGDGFVNIGFVDAGGLDLAAVKISGDLGRIIAGNADETNGSVKSLEVQSMGRLGTSTQAMGGDLQSAFVGTLGKLVVKSDIKDASLSVTGGYYNGNIGSVTVGGSLIGGVAAGSGRIAAEGDIGPVKITGSIQGNAGAYSGSISAGWYLGAVAVGGSLVGGDGFYSGYIISYSTMTSVKIGGSVIGGAGNNSGQINASYDLGSVTIGRNLQGDAGSFSGSIRVFGDLGSVAIGGSVTGDGVSSGRIEAVGDIKAVKIGSNLHGGDGAFSGSVVSSNGTLGSVSIGNDLKGGAGESSGQIASYAGTSSVTIGGSLTGGDGEGSGRIASDGTIAAVKVRGDLQGGVGDDSGSIGGADLGKLSVSGNVFGSMGERSGAIRTIGSLSSLLIGGDVTGGDGLDSAHFHTGGNAGSISIAGDLRGGGGDGSGQLSSDGNLGAVKIGGSLVGGSAAGTASLSGAGAIIAGGAITSVSIGQDILAGEDDTSGLFFNNSVIRAGDSIGSLEVKGFVAGNDTSDVFITARGQASNPTTGTDLAIGKITIGGRVEHARFLGGYSLSGTGVDGDGGTNADAQIGPVSVSGDWIASSIAAGTSTGADNVWGTMDDHVLTGPGVKDSANILARIASIAVKGQILGTVGGADHFGFVAQSFGSFKVNTTTIPIPATPQNQLIDVAPTFDVSIRRVSIPA